MATELGYYFTDLIFKEHGLRKADVEESLISCRSVIRWS